MTRSSSRLGRGIAGLLAALTLLVATAPAAHARGLDDERSPRVHVTHGPLPLSGTGTARDPAIGEVAPTLTGLSLTGKKTTVANDGKARIVLFLSHACPHCQREVPEIVRLAKAGKLDGVEIDTVTTNTTRNLPNWPPSKWLRREHWPFHPVLADDSRLRAFIGYGGTAFPYFAFVGADGKIAARAAGELSATTITRAVERLAAGQTLFPKQRY